MSTRKPAPFDLRSGSLDALLLTLRSADLDAVLPALQQHLDASPGFFDGEALAIDLRRLDGQAVDVDAVAQWLRQRGLRPIGVVADDGVATGALPRLHDASRQAAEAAPPRPAQAAAAPASAPPAPPAQAAATPASLTVDRPVRSGQRVYSPGDVIVIGAVSHGAEIIAGGNIHVYGALRGRALAGAHGDTSARVFCTCLEPELVAVAGVYRTSEQALPAEVASRPAQVSLVGDSLRIEPLILK